MKITVTVSLIITTLFLFAIAAAQSLPVLIRSVYHRSGDGAPNEIVWQIKPGTGHAYQVFAPGNPEPIALLSYDANGALYQVEKRIWQGKHYVPIIEKRTSSLLLSDGFPIPYDYLAPFQDVSETVEIKKHAGGLVFKKTYQRHTESVDFNDALASGQLSDAMAEIYAGKRFHMISVFKGDTLIVRQLWPDKAGWWVYEETPLRRSWRQ